MMAHAVHCCPLGLRAGWWQEALCIKGTLIGALSPVQWRLEALCYSSGLFHLLPLNPQKRKKRQLRQHVTWGECFVTASWVKRTFHVALTHSNLETPLISSLLQVTAAGYLQQCLTQTISLPFYFYSHVLAFFFLFSFCQCIYLTFRLLLSHLQYNCLRVYLDRWFSALAAS